MDAVYARQSVDKKDSISIESQIEFCKKEVFDNAYKVYIDKGYSGSNINRPAFEEMLKDIEMGKIDRVVVYKLDRVSRSLLDFSRIIDFFNKYKVEFISQTEKFDTSTSIGRAMLSIVMVFAQLERETIQQRVRDNYYQRGKNGLYLGGAAPFGYNKVESTLNGKKTYMLEEDPATSDFVRKIYDMYSEGNKSLGLIAREVNSILKIKTNKGNNWTACSLGRLIKNPVYVRANADVYLYLKNKGAILNNDICDFAGENGCFLYGERKLKTRTKFSDMANEYVTIAPHKGLINSEQWLKCQYRADENRCLKNSGRGMHSWLSGLMKCGYCGYAVTVVNSRNKFYINCGGRKMGFCNGRQKVIHLKDIEDITELKLIEKIKTLKHECYQNLNPNSRQVNELKIKLATVEVSIRKLVDSLLKLNEVSGYYINEKISELDNEKKALLKEISEMTFKSGTKKVDREDITEYLKNWKTYGLEQKKGVARALVERINITDDRIEIVFKL